MHNSACPFHKVGLHLYCYKQQKLTLGRYYGEGSRRYPHGSNSHAIGLCTGSFAAAAISVSQTISELIPAAIEAVLVAFRTGLRSFEARNDIEHRSLASPVWSMIVGMQEEQACAALHAFSKTKVSTSTPAWRLPLTVAGSFEKIKTLRQRSHFYACNGQRSFDGPSATVANRSFAGFETRQACNPCSLPRCSHLRTI